MSTCPLCDRRRGTRSCPTLNAEICARCCGTKRRRQVNCPKECAYLMAAQARVAETDPEIADLDRVRDMDPEFIGTVEMAITITRETRFRDLKDREVREALSNLLKTVETDERGLIYKYRSPDPRIQIVADAVTRVIQQYRQGENVSHKVGVTEVKACLLTAINAAKATSRRAADSTEYLDLIARSVPAPAEAPVPTSRLILP